MKRTLLIAAAFLTILACKKETENNNNDKPGADDPDEEFVQITNITLDKSSITIPSNADKTTIGITVTPAKAIIKKDLEFSNDNKDLLGCELSDEGLVIWPKKEVESDETAKVTVAAKEGPASDVHLSVTVTKAEIPVSIALTGDKVADGVINLTEGEVWQATAVIKDKNGYALKNTGVLWEVVQGEDRISVDQNGKITCQQFGASEMTGKQAKLKVTTATDANIYAEYTVDIAAIESLVIDRSGDNFDSGNQFIASADNSFTLTKKVYNSRDEVMDINVSWTVTGTATGVSINENGVVTLTESANGTATVTCSVTDKPSVKDNVTVKVVPQPTGFSFSGEITNPNWNYGVKTMKSITFTVKVLPDGARQAIKVSGSNFTATTEDVPGGVKVTLTSTAAPSKDASVITISAKEKESVKQTLTIFTDMYEKNEIKCGDYVFYNGNSETPFGAVDCGIRWHDKDNPPRYDGGSTSPISFSTYQAVSNLGWTYIGVVASAEEPTVEYSYLSSCRNTTTYLYSYRNFKLENFAGLVYLLSGSVPKKHVLVAGADHSGTMVWQDNYEEIANSDGKTGAGIYHYQLKGVLALSNDEAQSYGGGCKSTTYGLIPHLLLNFYNRNVDSQNKVVKPVEYIEDTYAPAHPVPSCSSGKCSGWFLPGKQDWTMIPDLRVLSKSLQSAGGPGVMEYSYWYPDESGRSYAYYCPIKEFGYVQYKRVFKDGMNVENTQKIGPFRARPFLIL